MNKKTYWKSLSPLEKEALADKLKVTKTYLSDLFNNSKKASTALCKKIEKATDGQVTKNSLRPDVWGRL